MRRLRALLHDLAEAVPVERRPALQHYREHLDAVIGRSFPDLEDQEKALQEDRQGLGLSRRQQQVTS